MSTRIILGIVLLVSSSGCGGGGSPFEAVGRAALESRPVKLVAEQVILSQAQVDCGVKEELWEQLPQTFGERTVARLTEKAKALKFDDDVTVTEPGYKLPYVQVRGELPIQVLEFVSVKDGPQSNTKDVEVKANVVINHPCFAAAPLPLMGVKRGKFNQDVNPVFELRQEGDAWVVDHVVH